MYEYNRLEISLRIEEYPQDLKKLSGSEETHKAEQMFRRHLTSGADDEMLSAN